MSGSDAMGGFDIYVAVNTAILNPTSAALGTLIASPSLTGICINGTPTTGSCTVNTANGPGIVEVTTIESSGGNECGGISPCSGMAFTITYSVVGSTPSTPLSYPINPGCSASSVSTPVNVCVEVADNTGTIVPENIQGATVTQTAVTHPTSTSVSCSPSSLVINQATSCTATVTDTSSGPTTPTGSVSFTTNSTGTFNPTSASCALVAGTTAGTATCPLSYTPTVTGHHLITGMYGGDSTHSTSQGTFTIPVAPTPPHATTTSISCSPGSVTVNTASSCMATVTDHSTTPTTPSGSVTLATNSTGTFTPFSASCNLAAGTTAGTASCSVSYQPSVIGHHLLTGSYSGDSTHSSSQGTFLLASTPAPLHITTTSVTCSPSSVTTGSPTSCAATVTDTSSSPTTPSGSVSFTTNSTGTFNPTSASCTLAAGTTAGTASCAVSYTPASTAVGHHLITGTYSGDSGHSTSNGSFKLAVAAPPPHPTSTSIQCAPATVQVSTPSTCTATVTDTSASGATTPTGSVGFTTNSTGTFSPVSASCALSAGTTAGTATCQVIYTPGAAAFGHHLITGNYASDSTHVASSGSFKLAVTAVPLHPTTTSVQCAPSPVQAGVATSCTATVTDNAVTGATTPSGSVSFATNSTGTFSPISASCTLTAGATAGTASCAVSYTPTVAGHHLVTANYQGDSTHAVSQGTFTLATTPAPHSTSTSVQCSPGSVQVSTSSTCTVTITDTSGTPTTPTGAVGFATNSTGTFNPTSASCTLAAGTAAGTATCHVSYTPGATAVGHHLITGNYAGDSTHVASSGSFNLAATAAPPPPPHPTSTTVQCSPASVQVSTPTSCTATVTDTSATGATTPSGSVSFTTNSTGTFNPISATCTLAAGTTAGTAACPLSYSPGASAVGHHLITGTYSTDSTHSASSGSFKLTVTSAPPPPPHPTSTVVQCSPSPVQVGSPTSCTATVTDTSSTGLTTPTGSVSFTTNSTGTFSPNSAGCTLSAGTVAGTANCSLSYNPTVQGHHLITGSYSGDSTHAMSSGMFNLATTSVPPPPPHPTSTTVQCSSASVQVSNPTTCTATVADTSTTSPSTPTGSISFTTNSTGTFSPTSASCTLAAGTAAGTATCSVTYTPGASSAGHHLITGNYAGDTTHATSSGTFKLAVTSAPPPPPHPTTTSILCSPSSVQANTATSCAATVTDTSTTGATTPTGTVTFTTNSTGTFAPAITCTLAGTTTGAASCSVSYTPTAAGHHLITGSYSGDSTHSSSTGSFNVAVSSVAPPPIHTTKTVVSCNPGSVLINTSRSCTARVIDNSTSPTVPTGTVTFTTNSTGTFNPPSATCTLIAGNGPNQATCSVSYTPTVTGKHLITGSYGGDSSHSKSSDTFTVNVRSLPGESALLTFNGFNVDDFDNGVGQLDVLVNGQLVVDLPAGLNHLTGTGDYKPYENTAVDFGPFDITSFLVNGQNTILFRDPTSFDHFGVVRNVRIVQGSSILLQALRARGVYPGFSFSYTFSNPPLTISSFTSSPAGSNRALTLTATYTGGTGPFTCIFRFGDGESMTIAGSAGTCSATHDYDHPGTFMATVTVRGSSTSDLVRSSLTINLSSGSD
jgi:hypothetical protein